MNNKLRLDTKINAETGIIEQSLREQSGGREFVYGSWAARTKEKAFREALIKLGWTPPGENNNLVFAGQFKGEDIFVTEEVKRVIDCLGEENRHLRGEYLASYKLESKEK